MWLLLPAIQIRARMRKIPLGSRFLMSHFFMFENCMESIEKQMTVGRTLTVGGPDKLLPDTPRNIVTSKYYNQSLPLIIGAVKHDGTYYAGGINFFSIRYFFFNHFSKTNPFPSRNLQFSGGYQ